jgi:hypothetical protein
MKKLTVQLVKTFNNVALKGIDLNIAKFHASKALEIVMKDNKCNLSKAAEFIGQNTNMNEKSVRNIANLRFLTLEQVKLFTSSDSLKKYASHIADSLKKDSKIDAMSPSDFMVSESANVVESNQIKEENKATNKVNAEIEKEYFAKLQKSPNYVKLLTLKFSKDDLKLIVKYGNF